MNSTVDKKAAALNSRTPPSIKVCIVNWNGRRHLEYSLPSLIGTQYPNLEILLVDNASKDGSVEYVRKTFPKVQVVQNASNLMWAGGNNVGVRIALKEGADWVMLANNDILADPRWAEMGMRIACSDSAIGIIGYNVLGESIRTDATNWYRACAEFTKLFFKDDQTITGCFLMIRTDVFVEIGLFDEVYGLYGEENDFIARAVKAGFRVVRCNLPIWHYLEGTSKSVSLFSAFMSTRNELRYYLKQQQLSLWGAFRWFLARMIIACNIGRPVNVDNACERRQCPTRNILVNVSLVLHAFSWNLLHLRETRSAGRMDAKRCAAVRSRNFEHEKGGMR